MIGVLLFRFVNLLTLSGKLNIIRFIRWLIRFPLIIDPELTSIMRIKNHDKPMTLTSKAY